MAKARGSWLARLERRLLVIYGPADVRGADSHRPEPPPQALEAPQRPAVVSAPEVVHGAVVEPDQQ